MASTDAIINVIVNGQQRVERIISSTNQLYNLIDSINRAPIDFSIGKGSDNAKNIDQLNSRLGKTQKELANTKNEIAAGIERMAQYRQAVKTAEKELEGLSLGTIKYSQVQRRITSNQQAFNEQSAAVQRLEKSLAGLQQRESSEIGQAKRAEAFKAQIEFANKLADTYLVVETAAKRLNGEIGNISKNRSSAVLKSEIQFFDQLAANVNLSSEAFRKFTAASGSAGIAAGEASRRKFAILAETFDPSVRATTAQGRIPSTESRTTQSQAAIEIQKLISAFPTVAKSRAGLEDYRSQLQSVLDLIPAGTERFIQLSNAIRTVDNELAQFGNINRQLGPQQFIQTAPSGPVSDRLNSLKEQQRYAKQVNDELAKQAAIEDRINQAILDEPQKLQLRNDLERAYVALSENELDLARRISREIDKQRFSLERQKRAQDASQRISGGSVYRTGEFSPIDGQKRINAILNANEMLMQKLNTLEASGINVISEKVTLETQYNNILSDSYEINLKNLALEEKTLSAISTSIKLYGERNKQLEIQAKGYPSSPIRGGVNMLGSPIYNETPFLERRFGKRGASAISEGLVGGAFPLLFGQGIGASIGGGLGGAAGGFAGGGLGFGLSLAGTALGSAFDALAKSAQETGASLKYPIEGFEKLKQANLFASREQEYYISKLIESGQTTKAAAEIQAEIIRKVGISGANDLTSLGDSSSRLSKAWAELNLQIQAALAGPLGGLLDWITNILQLANQTGRSEQRAKDVGMGLYGEAQQSFYGELQRIDNAQSIYRKFGPLFGGISEEEANRQRNALSNFYTPFSQLPTAAKPSETPEEQQKKLEAAIEAANRIRSINEEGVSIQRSADDLRLNIEDTVYGLRKRASDMEREAINFRRSVEDEIFNKRQELEKIIIDNDRLRQQNQIDALDLQLQKASSDLDPIAQGIVDAARQYIKTRAEGEADLQQKERQLKLDLQKIDQEVNRYQLQVEERVSQMSLQRDEFARDVSRTRLQIEKQIGDYNIRVEKYRLEMAKLRVDEEIRAGRIAEATATARQQGLISGGPGFLVGSTGRSTGPHLDIRNPSGNRNAVIDEALVIIREWQRQNLEYIKLSNAGINIKNMTNEGQLRAALAREQSIHGQRSGGGAVDIAVPAGTLVPVQVGAPKWDPNGGGWYTTSLATGNRFLHGLPQSRASQAGAAAVAATMPAIPTSRQAPAAPAPPTMPELPSAPAMIQINDLMSQYLEIQKQIEIQMQKGNELKRASLAIELEAARAEYMKQTLAPIAQFEQENNQLQIEIENRKERNRLAAEGYSPEAIEGKMKMIELERTYNSILIGQQKVANEQAVAALKKIGINSQLIDSTFNLTEATAADLLLTVQDTKKREELRGELERILKFKNDAIAGVAGKYDTARFGIQSVAEQSVMSPTEKIQERVGALNQEMDKLTGRAEQIIGAADAIGEAFSSSFKGVIDGSMTAQEALASFFQNTANYFLDMAAQIISKMIQIQILNAVTSLLPGAASIGPVAKADGIVPKPNFYGPAYASGGMFMNGIQPFARGGIVSSPTLFKFANGGAMGTGLMGEAGPEAIMPLKRGPGGRLGVDASGSGGGVNVTVNVDATGSSVQGDGRQAGELGRALSAAVQQELIKQKRPGGLLA